MFKMLDKLYNHWEQKRRESEWFFFVIIGELIVFMVGTLYIFYMIAPYIGQISYFSKFSRLKMASYVWSTFAVLFVIIIGAWGLQKGREEEKDKERLINRKLSDYIEKYRKYVDFIESLLQTGNYKEVCLSENWVIRFDNYLDSAARLRTKWDQEFTDFEVVACLMYALTDKLTEAGIDINTNIPFALECAKAFLRTPNIYQCKRIEGYELILEPRVSAKEVSFEDIEISTLLETQEFIGVYLSRRETYSQILELADFLHIFYLRCGK